jgi:hypothetical protein
VECGPAVAVGARLAGDATGGIVNGGDAARHWSRRSPARARLS